MQGPVAAAEGEVSADCLEEDLDEEVEEEDLEEANGLEEDFPEGKGATVWRDWDRDSKDRDSSSHKISNIESKWPRGKGCENL